MTDHRSPLAKARDWWLGSDEALRLQSPGATGLYIKNRLEAAFCAGWDAAESQLDAARAEARKAALEEAATWVMASGFVDGPSGTIEGQIAAGLRALAQGEKP